MSIQTVLSKETTFHEAINQAINKTRLLKTVHYSKFINSELSHKIIASKFINHFQLVEYFYGKSTNNIYEYLKDFDLRKFTIEDDNNEAKIYISFHYGLYRLIPYLLSKAGKKCIVVRESHGEYELENDFYKYSFINARDSGCYLKILNNLRNNINVLIFIDINNIENDISKSQKIKFLEKEVSVLNSVFKFSYRYTYKVAPLIIYYNEEGKIETKVFENIEKRGEENFDTYSKRCCQMTYKILEKSIYKDPVQWEQIYQLDTYFQIQNKQEDEDLQNEFNLNVDYCTVYRIGNTYIVYNSLNNRQYTIDKHMYILLMILKKKKIKKGIIIKILNNKENFEFLRKEKIIC